MKKSVLYVITVDSIFLLFIILSGILSSVSPALSQAAYYMAFAASLITFLVLARGRDKDKPLPKLLPSKEGILLTIPIIAPSILAVMGISYVTALLLSLAGKEQSAFPSGDFWGLFLLYALIPAVLEELVFRYVPMTLIAPHSKKSATVISALLFAFVHCDLFEIPYALFAGFLYAILDIALGSVLPSMLLHLLNNTFAILWQTHIIPSNASGLALAILGGLGILSAVAIIFLRKSYQRKIGYILDSHDKTEMPTSSALFVAVTGAVAVLSLF